jgi:anti-sigma regulatory factor (Ser/Thr protein kinase)/DNA-directed RNA polymerase subunit RPC12/RpoP
VFGCGCCLWWVRKEVSGMAMWDRGGCWAEAGLQKGRRVPYYRCADCDLTVYSAAGYSNARVCPHCGADLRAASRVFVSQVRQRELHRQMVREPQAAGAARRELDLLLGELERGEFDLTALLVSELIANSVQQAGPRASGPLALDVSVTDASVRVTVTDGGGGFVPDVRTNKEPTDGDWGLQLVDELADRWGINTDSGTSVWFELDRSTDAQQEERALG